MESLVRPALLLLLFSFSVANVSGAALPPRHHKLIVLLIDGFRWDYLDDPHLKLKGFPSLIKQGVKAEYLNPVYPSLSYPNINSFATGLFPESHGFVDNMLWDKRTNTFFEMIPAMNSSEPMWWQDAEPIWITAEKTGLRSALYWWAGCEVKIHGHHPQICERHRFDPPSEEGKRDMMQRVDDIVEMFRPSKFLSYERLDLAMMYYSGVDWAGHYTSMDSKEFKNSIYYIDEVLDYMQKAISRARLSNEVNIIVVSDHGMADVRNSTFISLEKYAQDIKYQVNAGPVISLVPQNGKVDKLYRELKADNITGVHVYKKNDIPESFHIKHADRVGQIVLECDQAYFIKALNDSSKRVGDIEFFEYYGEHGYDPEEYPDMRAIFYATGPAFRSGFTSKPLEMVDIYNVMCHILGIDALPNNGTWEHVKPILRRPADGPYLSHSRNSAFSAQCYTCPILIVIFTTIFSLINMSVL